jgi:hypothetical protein
MKRSGWRRPSPALAVACLALFVALGGTVLAAAKIDGRTIRVKSLPGDRLEVGSLPGNRLQPGTVRGNRIAPGSIDGSRIAAGTLGDVPAAVHATSADEARRAQSALTAAHAEDATTVNGRGVGCSGGTREYAGACWDLSPTPTAVTATEAAAACAARGGELPNGLPLLTYLGLPGIAAALHGEWTSNLRVDAVGAYGDPVVEGGGVMRLESLDSPHQFRCVVPLID